MIKENFLKLWCGIFLIWGAIVVGCSIYVAEELGLPVSIDGFLHPRMLAILLIPPVIMAVVYVVARNWLKMR